MFPQTWISRSEEYWDNPSILQADVIIFQGTCNGRQRYYYKTVISKQHLKNGVSIQLRYVQTIIHDGQTFKG
ncbi:hypothetical protein DPMN_157211 [Dreissena polymorpha]|uniref:Uncharacterized protein n=1 Tax=Dreissena polymorpha TaxID=45954 RepID=A0A9D4EGS8_DREPO|nr:hypothetical protein DPMN_157211 [Dreissena polymorpha]